MAKTKTVKPKTVKRGKHKGQTKKVYKKTDVGRLVTFTDAKGNVIGTRGDKKGKSKRQLKRAIKKIKKGKL